MKLDLQRLWEVCNKLFEKQDELSEKNTYVYLLGNRSNYYQLTFEGFLNYYSFKIEENSIIVFNDDGIPWEDYTRNDFSYIPICLLSFGEKELDRWVETKIELQLEKQAREKLAEKENIKLQIERLTKQLNS